MAERPGTYLGLRGLVHFFEVDSCDLVGFDDGLFVGRAERVGMRVVLGVVCSSELTLWVEVDTSRAGSVQFDVDIVEGFASGRVHDLLLGLLGGLEALSGTDCNGGGGVGVRGSVVLEVCVGGGWCMGGGHD